MSNKGDEKMVTVAVSGGFSCNTRKRDELIWNNQKK